MPTNHDPPRPSTGERTKGGRGRKAKKPGQTKRQRAVDPERLRVVREMLIGTDYYEMQEILAQRWAVSMRTIRDYRQRVLEMMREELQSESFLDPDMEAVLGLQQLDAARLRAIARNDGRTEVACIRLRLQVTGVIGPDRHLHLHAPPAPVPAAPSAGALAAASDLDPAMAAKREIALRLAARLRGSEVIDMKPAPQAPQEATTK